MPSQLNASPKGEPLHVAAVFGNGANWLATPASESSVKFTLSVNAHPRAVACAWMIALYRSCSPAKTLVSAGSIPGGAVQSSVVGAPACAAASSPKPYGKLTRTVSPRGGAQFAATVKGAGANAPPAHRPYHVVPREKNGNATLLTKWPSPTAIRTALAPVAWIESSALA